MSANAERELGVVAFQFLGKVGEYDREICALVDEWPEADRLQGIDTLLQEMHVLGAILPHVAPAWAHFLGSHQQLVGRLRTSSGRDPQRLDWLEAHVAAVLSLESACLDVLGRRR